MRLDPPPRMEVFSRGGKEESAMSTDRHDAADPFAARTACEAVARWLDGDYRCGNESALIAVIRRGSGSRLSDLEIREVIHRASDCSWDAAAVMEQLAGGADEGRVAASAR